jgi:hypothetical protein
LRALAGPCFAALALACGPIDNRALTPLGDSLSSGSGGAATGGSTAAGGSTRTGGASGVGGVSTAGSSGTGGTTDPTLQCVAPSPVSVELIDDMEDGDNWILPVGGRDGGWFVYDDGSGNRTFPLPMTDTPVAPLPAPRGSSSSGAHFAGAGFTVYAGLGFSLTTLGGGASVYDASAYAGVRFYLMGKGPVRLQMETTIDSTPAQDGNCTADCNLSYGADLSATASWVEHTILFCELTPRAPTTHPFDPAELLRISFAVGTKDGPAGAVVDFWIDDVSFITR